MDFDPNEFVPKANQWFDKDIKYEGVGYATCTGLDEKLSGPTTVTVGECGECKVTMLVTNLGNGPMPEYDREKFLKARKEIVCEAIEVKCPDGNFTTVGELNAYVLWNHVAGAIYKIECTPQRSTFLTFCSGNPYYWVAPILNFVSGFPEGPNDLEDHPLRFYTKKSVIADLVRAGHKSEMASDVISEYFIEMYVGCIPFAFNGKPAFIEPMPGFESIREELEDHKGCAMTAVMVSEINNEDIGEIDLQQRFCWGFSSVLTLVAGTDVSFAWVEYRDRDGSLVRRDHVRWAEPRFQRGHPAISYQINNEARQHGAKVGTGYLLTVAPQANVFGNVRVLVACRRLTRFQNSRLTMDDRFDQVCRALEALYSILGDRSITLFNELDDVNKNKVRDVLNMAGSELERLAAKIASTGDKQTARPIRRIAGRVRSDVGAITSKFEEKVIHLLNKYKLKDYEVMAEGTDNGIVSLKEPWHRQLSKYRNENAHDGHLSTGGSVHGQIRVLGRHLYDIGVRIILMEFGYDETYVPIMHEHSIFPVQWVQVDTTAESLGYK